MQLPLQPYPIMQLTINGQSRQTADHATIAELLDELKLSGKPVAVKISVEMIFTLR